MKRALLLLVLSLASPGAAAGDGVPLDKIAHAGISYVVTDAMYEICDDPAVSERQRVGFAVASALLVGLGKEAIDSITPKNRWDWQDVHADALGIGLALAFNVRWGALFRAAPAPGGAMVSMKF